MTIKENKQLDTMQQMCMGRFGTVDARLTTVETSVANVETSVQNNLARIVDTEKTIIKELNNGIKSEVKTLKEDINSLEKSFNTFFDEYKEGKRAAQEHQKWLQEVKLEEKKLHMADKKDKRNSRRLLIVPIVIAVLAFMENFGITNFIPHQVDPMPIIETIDELEE